MKKSRLTAVLAALVLLAAGCGNGAAKEIDPKALADSLVSGIAYDDELQLLEEDAVAVYLDMEEGVTASMYMGSGSTAEEVAVFDAPDEETAKKQKEHVQTYLEDQAESFRDYIPEETKRVESAVLEQKGKYVVLCVSGDSDKAKEIIEEAFK